ncbi:hypothetical protein Q3G72_013504 [Acer saccharum]|nr:hypothetical protein Q3G72_013504 [Acer saccharum]
MATHISSRSLLSKLLTTTKPLHPLAASSSLHLGRSFPAIRSVWSCAISNLDDECPEWPPRPPKGKRLPPGRDFEHWLIRKEEPDPNFTRDEIIDTYVKTLALVLGSVQVARMKIYSVSTKFYYAFGARVPEEVAIRISELPNIKFVIPDQYVNVKTKEYMGEPFINGQAVPYHPKYHKEQINNSKEPEIIRKNPPEDNIPPSGNYQVPPKMGASEWNRHYYLPHMPSGGNLYRLPNMGGVPPKMGAREWNRHYYLPYMPSGGNLYRLPNMGGVPQGNYGGMPPPNNAGGMPPLNKL